MIAPMQAPERLIVALDFARRDEILRAADQLQGVAGCLKIGLQAFVANGPALVRELIGSGHKVFLDLKLHDIPNTVSRATAAAAELGVFMLTVHAAGGLRMMREAADAGKGVLLLAVTVLTSLSDQDMTDLGYRETTGPTVLRLASLARQAGLKGVICSPLEIAAIRVQTGPDFLIVTPGIRAPGEGAGDQSRTLSAAEAVQAGADFIVVGRPITRAPDPRAAAQKILEQLS